MIVVKKNYIKKIREKIYDNDYYYYYYYLHIRFVFFVVAEVDARG